MKQKDLDKRIDTVLPKATELLRTLLPQEFHDIFMTVIFLTARQGEPIHSDFGNEITAKALSRCEDFLEKYNKAH